jgi:hypothetical protein
MNEHVSFRDNDNMTVGRFPSHLTQARSSRADLYRVATSAPDTEERPWVLRSTSSELA